MVSLSFKLELEQPHDSPCGKSILVTRNLELVEELDYRDRVITCKGRISHLETKFLVELGNLLSKLGGILSRFVL